MKKTVTIILPILSALLLSAVLSACGAAQDIYTEMRIDTGEGSDGRTHAVYNGDGQELFSVAEGQECTVKVSVTKDSGSLRIVIHAEDDPNAVLYDGHDFPAEHFTVTVREPGAYRVLVHAEDFVGSYQLRYDMGQ